MNPAEFSRIRSALERQGSLFVAQEQELLITKQALVDITTRLWTSGNLNMWWGPRLPVPPTYGGDPGTCCSFPCQCFLIFELQTSTDSKVAYAINLLLGWAREWSTLLWDAYNPCCFNFEDFSKEMRARVDSGLRLQRPGSFLILASAFWPCFRLTLRSLICTWIPLINLPRLT